MYGVRYDAEQEVTVTAGATQALLTSIAAFVRGGDEVIVFAPFYDSYVRPLVKEGASLAVTGEELLAMVRRAIEEGEAK